MRVYFQRILELTPTIWFINLLYEQLMSLIYKLILWQFVVLFVLGVFAMGVVSSPT